MSQLHFEHRLTAIGYFAGCFVGHQTPTLVSGALEPDRGLVTNKSRAKPVCNGQVQCDQVAE